MFIRKDPTVIGHDKTVAVDYLHKVCDNMRNKADHNKLESQTCLVLIIVCTLSAPLFVTLGQSVLFGKIVPSVLSLMAAALTSWMQVRKPQKLWSIYRTAQRRLETEKVQYDLNDGDYPSNERPDLLLARRVSEVSNWAHEQWMGLVPEPEILIKSPEKTQ